MTSIGTTVVHKLHLGGRLVTSVQVTDRGSVRTVLSSLMIRLWLMSVWARRGS